MRNRPSLLFVLLALALHPAVAACQQVAIQIEGGKQTVLAKSDLESLPREDHDHRHWLIGKV
ncbi:MAG: hypothetical protein WB566_17955 [Terriglobales bacterium]